MLNRNFRKNFINFYHEFDTHKNLYENLLTVFLKIKYKKYIY